MFPPNHCFPNYLSVFRRRADPLHRVVTLLQGLRHAGLDVLDVAFLLEVLATLVLGWCRSDSAVQSMVVLNPGIYLSARGVLSHIRKVALFVHLVNTLLHWDLLNALQRQFLEDTELAVILSLHRGEVETFRKIRRRLNTGW